MKNKLLAAAVAAICFSGCNEPTKPTQTTHASSAVTKAEQPVVISAKSDPIPPVEQEVSATKGDGGNAVEPEPRIVQLIDDGLPLDHSHRTKVDHMARAIALKETGDIEGALTEARRALFDDASDDTALRFITRVGKMVGNKEFIAQAWGRIAKLQVDDAIPLVQQSRWLVVTGDYEGAVKIAREAARRDTTSAEPYQAMGRAFFAAGNIQESIDAFHKAVELNPEHGYAMNNLGFAYLRSNQNAQAVFILEKAAELLPHVAFVQNNLGVALERMGRSEEAKAAYQKAMDLSPKYVKARINSARISKVARVSDDVPLEATPIEMDQTSDVPEMFEQP